MGFVHYFAAKWLAHVLCFTQLNAKLLYKTHQLRNSYSY
jgi:hypothetical protein